MNTYKRECDKGHSFAASHPDDPCPVCAVAGLNPLPGGARRTEAIYNDSPAALGSTPGRRTVSTYEDGKVRRTEAVYNESPAAVALNPGRRTVSNYKDDLVRRTEAVYNDNPAAVGLNPGRRTVSIYAEEQNPSALQTSPHSRSHVSSPAAVVSSVSDFQAAVFDSMPVAWMVAVVGPLRGRDYRVPDGRSSFGRDPGSRIPLIGDDTISWNQGFINYTRSRSFSICPGDGTALIYINGQEVLSPMQLKPFDRVEVGRTTLLFVPFCGDQFDWTDGAQNKE